MKTLKEMKKGEKIVIERGGKKIEREIKNVQEDENGLLYITFTEKEVEK